MLNWMRNLTEKQILQMTDNLWISFKYEKTLIIMWLWKNCFRVYFCQITIKIIREGKDEHSCCLALWGKRLLWPCFRLAFRLIFFKQVSLNINIAWMYSTLFVDLWADRAFQWRTYWHIGRLLIGFVFQDDGENFVTVNMWEGSHGRTVYK